MSAKLVTLDDGERAVRLVGLVSQADWEAAGRPSGMSFSMTQLIGRVEGPNPHLADLTLSADAGWWDDEDIAQASNLMSQVAPTQAQRLLQFSVEELARIVLYIPPDVLQQLILGVGANAIWDGIKLLLTRKRQPREGSAASQTRIELSITVPRGHLTAVIDSPDAEMVKTALEKVSDAVAALQEDAAQPGGPQTIKWDDSAPPGGRWVPPA